MIPAPVLRPALLGSLASLALCACYGELSDGAYPEHGAGTSLVGVGQPSDDPALPSPAEPPSLGPAAPSDPPPAQPTPAPEPGAPTPPPSSHLTVTGIVGGAHTVTQPYGPAAVDYGYAYCHDYGDWPAGQVVHCGVDIGLGRGHPLAAPDSGTVTTAGGTGYYTDAYNASAGQLTLQLDDGTQVIFGHCSELHVSNGQRVKRGQQVALSGQSSTGENGHLHLEVRVPSGGGLRTVDPIVFLGP